MTAPRLTLAQRVAELVGMIEQQGERIEALEQVIGEQSIPHGWVALKRAKTGVSYEALRQRCERGTLKHVRVRGRIYIDPGDLVSPLHRQRRPRPG